MRWRSKVVAFFVLLALVIGAGLWLRHRAGRAPGADDRPAGAEVLRAGGAGADLAAGKAAPAEEPAGPEPPNAAAEQPAAGGALPVSIEGRVTDASGNGVPHARVRAAERTALAEVITGNKKLLEFDALAALRAFQESLAGVETGLPSCATALDGTYALRGLPDGDHRVVVTHEEFLTHAEENWILVQAGRRARYDVELVAGQAIAGLVRDTKGAPIAGVRVQAAPVETARLKGLGKLVQVFIAQSEGRALFETRPAETDARGAFRLTSLEPGVYDLRLVREGYAWGDARGVTSGTRDLVVVLAPALRVTGRVISPLEAPIENARVVLREPPVDIHGPDGNMAVALLDLDIFGEKERSGATDAEGRFELQGFAKGAYEVAIRADGFAERVERVTLERALLDMGDVVLDESRELSGTVLSPEGGPIEGAEVWVPKPSSRNEDPDSRRISILEAGPLSSLVRSRTDERGEFLLGGLAGDAHELAVLAEGYPGETLSSAAADGKVTITLRHGVTIRGVVIEAESGDPVPGAQVVLETRPRNEQTTDERGCFEFKGMRPDEERTFGATAVVRASHERYGEAREPLVFPDPGAAQVVEAQLVLDGFGAEGSKAWLSGIVRDARGEPLAGARVWAEVPGFPAAFLRIGFFGARGAEGRTAADGTFTIAAPRCGNLRFDLLASYPGCATSRAGPFAADSGEGAWPFIEIRLGQGASVEGRVTSSRDGAPIAGARVRIWRDTQVPDEATLFTRLLPQAEGEVTYCARDGAFRLRRIEPGAYWVEARAAGHAAKTLGPVEIAAGPGASPEDGSAPADSPVRIDIALEAGASLAGRVVGAGGEPLSGVEVVAFPVAEAYVPPPDSDDEVVQTGALGAAGTVTRGDGAYKIEHLPDAEFHVLARARGFEPASISPVVPGQPLPDIVLLQHGSVIGRVSDAETEAPVAEFSLSFERQGADGEFRTEHRHGRDVRDAGGRFACEGMRAGEWRVRVASKDHVHWRGNVSLAPGGTAELDVVLHAGSRIEGTVALPDGTPVAGAAIHIRLVPRPRPGERTNFDTRTEENGVFVAAGLEGGSYQIEATHPDCYAERAEGSAKVDVSAAGAASVGLVLRPAGRVLGRVHGLGIVRPGEDIWIVRFTPIPVDPDPAASGTELAAASLGAPFECWTDAQGTFQRDSVRPGKYRLELSHKRSVEDPERPGGKWVVAPEDGGPLGEVEIRAGELAFFEGEAP